MRTMKQLIDKQSTDALLNSPRTVPGELNTHTKLTTPGIH